ncbi:MAG: PKD domain-containing protein, partial [Proteobacteria bacterium]|nr:PKD domain-containing protein [Pseudomonadota bacterium]
MNIIKNRCKISLLMLLLCLLVPPALAAAGPDTSTARDKSEKQVKSTPEFGEDLKISGMLKMLSLPDKQGKLARMLYHVRRGKLMPQDFFKQMATLGANKDDLIEVKKQLEQHAVRTGNKSLMNDILGAGFAEGGTPVEKTLYAWRRTLTTNAIDETIKRFVDQGRIPKHGFGMMISHVGKWATQVEKAMTFAGDIDFSFVCNDTELAKAMKAEFEGIMKKQTGLSTLAIDAVATVHGRAGLEVYIGRHGMQFAEMQMKDNFYVDMITGEQKEIGIEAMKGRLAYERAIADIQGIAVPKPSSDSEPGLSMEMVRHFDHDIVKTGVYGTLDSVLKASKYLHRSNEALANTNQKPADASLATLAFVAHDLDRFDPQTPEIRELLLKAIAEHFGVEPKVVWDAGQNRLMLDLDPGTIVKFHEQVKSAMWDNVQKGMDARYTDIFSRQSDLLARKRQGEKIAAEAENLRTELVELLDMVEAEIKAFGDAPVPDLVKQKAVQIKKLLEQLSDKTGVRKLSIEELKDKRLVEEMLKSKTPQSRKMVAAYVMDRALAAAEYTIEKGEQVNNILDIIDDGLSGDLRGETGFAALEAEINDLKMARLQGKPAEDIGNRLVAMKNQAKGAIAETNRYLNEKLQATSVGRNGMKLMMITGLVDEMKAYGNALYEGKWDEFAAEFLRRRVPFVSSAEKLYMGNTYLAVWDVMTTLVPPLALPEAAWGLGRAIGEKSYGMYWNEQLALFSDALYADAVFKLTEVQTQGEGDQMTKLGVYRLEATYYNNLRLDLKGFAAMRKDQVDSLRSTVNSGHINWKEYKKNFTGFTEWIDVSDTLRNNLTATDPALILLEEMINHVAVGDKFRDRMAELGLARWEEIKLGYILNQIDHLEKRKQAEDALERGQLPDLFAELRKMVKDLDIEQAVLKSLDAEADTSNYKALVNMLWQTKRDLSGQAALESEISRASQVVLRYLDIYKKVMEIREASLKNLPENYQHDGSQRWMTGLVFLRGQPDADLEAAKKWNSYTILSRMDVIKELLAIKHEFLPNTRLESQAELNFVERAWRQQLWMKPFTDAGQAARSNAWLDRAISYGKKRNQIYDEFRASLEQDAPVQLTLVLKDAKDPEKAIKLAQAQASPTDELGQASGTTGSDLLVLNLIKGRYRITIQAKGYQVYTRDETLGSNLNKAPQRVISLVPLAGKTDSDEDLLTEGLEWQKLLDLMTVEKKNTAKYTPKVLAARIDAITKALEALKQERQKWLAGWKPYLTALDTVTRDGWDMVNKAMTAKRNAIESECNQACKDCQKKCAEKATAYWNDCMGSLKSDHQAESLRLDKAFKELPGKVTELNSKALGFKEYFTGTQALAKAFQLPFPYPDTVIPIPDYDIPCLEEAEKSEPDKPAKLDVTLKAPTQVVEVGTLVTLTASVGGLAAPFQYSWSGAAGSNGSANFTPSHVGDWSVSVKVTDAQGNTGDAIATVRVGPGKIKIKGLKGEVFYGSQNVLNTSGMGLVEPPPPSEPSGTEVDCAKHPDNPFCVDTSGNIARIPSKGSEPWDDKFHKTHEYIPPIDQEFANGIQPMDPYRVVWQSEPGLTFDPPQGPEGITKVTYDRMGEVKIWCELLKNIEGAYQTVAESDQQTINVIAPALSISYDPANGKAYVGQQVTATLHAKPGVGGKLIDYRWLDPATSNRLELDQNGGRIAFTVKDINPIKLKVLARVPVHGDDIGEVESSYTGIAFGLNAWMVQPPNLPQTWDPKAGGLKTIARDSRATGELITLKAELQGGSIPDGIRWKWEVNPGTTLSNDISQSPTVSRSEAGTIEARVTAKNKDGSKLGEAQVTVQVIKIVTAPANAKSAPVSKDPDTTKASAADKKTADTKGSFPDWGKPSTDPKEAARQFIDKAREQLAQGDMPAAEKTVLQAKKLDPKAAAPIITEVAKAAKKSGWQAVNLRDFSKAVKDLQVSDRLVPDDKDTREKLKKAQT